MAVIYDQFCSQKFTNFLKYTWHVCGYDDQHPSSFETPTEWCFNLDKMTAECHHINCDNDPDMINDNDFDDLATLQKQNGYYHCPESGCRKSSYLLSFSSFDNLKFVYFLCFFF